jgi:hypothetical protein
VQQFGDDGVALRTHHRLGVHGTPRYIRVESKSISYFLTAPYHRSPE